MNHHVTHTNGTLVKPQRKRVFIVDDHPAIRTALSMTINATHDLEVCGEAGSAEEAYPLLNRLRPDAAIIDISLEDVHGLDMVETIKVDQPEVGVVVFSMYDENIYAERALRAGAGGYVMKSEPTDTILNALRAVLQNEVYVSRRIASRLLSKVASRRAAPPTHQQAIEELTDREMGVFQMLGEGYSMKEVADRLHISYKTAETYRRRAKHKLGFGTTAELLQYAVQWMYGQGGRQ